MRFACLACLCLLLAGPSLYGDEKTQQLAAFLPNDINSLSILRFRAMLDSPLGEKEGWSAIIEEQFEAGTADLPPWLDTLVVGSLVRPNVPEEVWATGVMHRPEAITPAAIAAHVKSTVTQIAGLSVVQTNRGSFLVDFPGQILGFYRPAHRQELVNWINANATESQSSFSPYLRKAVDNPADLILSLNLQDMFDPAFVQTHLNLDERFRDHRNLIASLTPLLAGIQGVTLAVDVKEQSDCLITIDFSSEVGASGAIVKSLFLAVLEDAGAMIDEFPQTRIRLAGNSLHLTCQLSDDSLRRLVSLIVPPRAPAGPEMSTPPESLAEQPPADPAQQAAAMLRASRRYLQSVNRMVDDLSRASSNATDARRVLTWHETFARKIEALPTTDVRPELVEYGQRTAQRLRSLASSLRGQMIRVDTQNQAITQTVTHFDPGWAYANYWGGAGYRPPSVTVSSNLAQVREQQAAAVTAGALDRAKIWDMIAADRAAMDRLMSGN